VTPGIDPRADAAELVGHRVGVRVLEPSIPAVTDAPWFADDPVHAPSDVAAVVSPLPNAEVSWDELARDDPRLAPFCAHHWLGAWPALRPLTEPGRVAATRKAWHALAEHVLAPARMAATGRLGLRFTAGGFGTPFFVHDGASVQLRVDGTELLVVRAAAPQTITRLTLRDATHAHEIDAAIVSPHTSVSLGYSITTDATPDVLGRADDDSAGLLADWYGFACSVLEELRAGAPDADATRCQLWAEHFDLAIELGDEAAGSRAGFGASPGDAEHTEPYLYVSPWTRSLPSDAFWNATAFTGAVLPYASLTGEPAAARAAALAFFLRGRDLLTTT
jgi:hypothetical protein